MMFFINYWVHGGHLGFHTLNMDRFFGAWDFFNPYTHIYPQKKFHAFVTPVTILQILVAKPLDYDIWPLEPSTSLWKLHSGRSVKARHIYKLACYLV